MLTTKEIMDIIPHRHPFLLVDTIDELEPGIKATGYKCITYDEPYFAGHFPAEPVMPGPSDRGMRTGRRCCDTFAGRKQR